MWFWSNLNILVQHSKKSHGHWQPSSYGIYLSSNPVFPLPCNALDTLEEVTRVKRIYWPIGNDGFSKLFVLLFFFSPFRSIFRELSSFNFSNEICTYENVSFFIRRFLRLNSSIDAEVGKYTVLCALYIKHWNSISDETILFLIIFLLKKKLVSVNRYILKYISFVCRIIQCNIYMYIIYVTPAHYGIKLHGLFCFMRFPLRG